MVAEDPPALVVLLEATLGRESSRTKTVAHDVVEQLRTPEEMTAYLDAWLSEAPDDPAGIARALG